MISSATIEESQLNSDFDYGSLAKSRRRPFSFSFATNVGRAQRKIDGPKIKHNEKANSNLNDNTTFYMDDDVSQFFNFFEQNSNLHYSERTHLSSKNLCNFVNLNLNTKVVSAKILFEPQRTHYEKLNKTIWNKITFLFKKGNNNEVDFNGETSTFTLLSLENFVKTQRLFFLNSPLL